MEYIYNDPSFTLAEWVEVTTWLLLAYGPDAIMLTDAGYNNVQLAIDLGVF